MKNLILKLMCKGYDVFIPIGVSNEIVISSVLGTKRCIYKQASVDNNRENYYIQNSSNRISEVSVKLDGLISYTPRGIFMIPIREVINKQFIRINSDKYMLKDIDSVHFPVENLVQEQTLAEEVQEEQNYFESILKDMPSAIKKTIS